MDPFRSHPSHGVTKYNHTQPVNLILELLLYYHGDVHGNERAHIRMFYPKLSNPSKYICSDYR